MRPMAGINAAIGGSARRGMSIRTLGSRNTPSTLLQRNLQYARPVQVLSRQSLIYSQSRRAYADQPVVKEKTKRRGRGFLRWTWRITYLSALGGLAFVAWNIYDQKYPEDQAAPDPNAKTLVVLGMRRILFMQKVDR